MSRLGKSPEFLQEMRNYCSGCILRTNCPVGMFNFKTCTHKTSNLIALRGKHIPTYSEEQESRARDVHQLAKEVDNDAE